MTQRKRVALLEFPVFPNGFPLASGYMEATARRDAAIAASFEFEKYSFRLTEPGIAESIEAMDADVYAFSCYVWNMGLIRRVLPRLRERRPDAQVILGGPQVMHKAQRYLDPANDHTVICNGEGERTFTNYLARIAAGERDFRDVRGLSFYRRGELVTTPNEERIRELDEIPSPYLEGYFPTGKYVWAPVETNRGCPFACTYCFWGAATNAKVHKYEQDRVFAELEWLSKNQTMYVVIIDANFGIYERDVEIARHLADCKSRYGTPMTVTFSSSKNTPERVAEITEIFQAAEMIATQPISLQSVSKTALQAVKRDNIKLSGYTRLQSQLNEKNASSYIEIIWPLPGETLESYKDGVSELCRLGADSFLIYPLMLINNVELETQREEHALVTISDPDPVGEGEFVVETKYVSRSEFIEGLRFGYHVISLHSVRGLSFLSRYLDESEKMTYRQLFTEFGHFCENEIGHPYTDYIEDMLGLLQPERVGHFFESDAVILHMVLHEHRAEFDRLLIDFAQAQPWWSDPEARLRLELDLLNRPHLYRDTPVQDRGRDLELLRVVEQTADGYVLEASEAHRAAVLRLLGLDARSRAPQIAVNYRTTQLPFMSGSVEGRHGYCKDRLRRVRSLLPVWSTVEAARAVQAREEVGAAL